MTSLHAGCVASETAAVVRDACGVNRASLLLLPVSSKGLKCVFRWSSIRRAMGSSVGKHANTHSDTHTRTHTHTHTHTHTRAPTRTHTHKHTLTHTQTHNTHEQHTRHTRTHTTHTTHTCTHHTCTQTHTHTSHTNSTPDTCTHIPHTHHTCTDTPHTHSDTHTHTHTNNTPDTRTHTPHTHHTHAHTTHTLRHAHTHTHTNNTPDARTHRHTHTQHTHTTHQTHAHTHNKPDTHTLMHTHNTGTQCRAGRAHTHTQTHQTRTHTRTHTISFTTLTQMLTNRPLVGPSLTSLSVRTSGASLPPIRFLFPQHASISDAISHRPVYLARERYNRRHAGCVTRDVTERRDATRGNVTQTAAPSAMQCAHWTRHALRPCVGQSALRRCVRGSVRCPWTQTGVASRVNRVLRDASRDACSVNPPSAVLVSFRSRWKPDRRETAVGVTCLLFLFIPPPTPCACF